jgi:hypothetical protein
VVNFACPQELFIPINENMKMTAESSSSSATSADLDMKKFVFIFVVVIFLLVYIVLETDISDIDTYDAYDIHPITVDVDSGHDTFRNSSDDVKYILLWNPYFGDPSYNLEKVRCGYHNR